MIGELGLRGAAFLATTVFCVGCGTSSVVYVESEDPDAVENITRRARTNPPTVILGPYPREAFPFTRLLAIDRDSVFFIDRRGQAHSKSVAVVSELVFERKISFAGPGVGALVGGILGGLIHVRTRDRGGDVVESEGMVFFLGFAGGILPGAAIGGIIAAALGSPRTVYRFRPDTPHQMSVVIGVGPMDTSGVQVE